VPLSNLPHQSTTSTDRNKTPLWGVFEDCIRTDLGITLSPEVFPAGTDSRFLRQVGIPALGFSPMRQTPVLLHEHNEYLTRNVFLEGCNVYEKLLPSLLEFAPPPPSAESSKKMKPV
jgi:aminoacylase